MSQTIIRTDSRGRVTLGHPNSSYLVTESSDGALTLEPATVISELELRFMRNTALQAQIADNQTHPERQRPRNRRRLAE
jgi:hypothetical protein